MQELRLVGVDGEHLLLSGEEGTSYRLPIDDELRAASSPAGTGPAAPPPAVRDEPRHKAPRPPVHLTPRDIQARIRTGATAEQVAAESGLELAHVQRYEGPVRAERDYVAYLAQRVEVATPLPSHDGYRSAFGDSPALLGDMVAYRVQSYGIEPGSLEWDSWRRPDGSWHVEASFDLPDGSRVDLGEQPPAQWTYNPTRKTVSNGNRWAQVLSELEPLDGPLPSRRLSAVADHVFDFEAEKADEAPEPVPGDQDGLLDVLRSRRGQRLGADEDGDDALAELLSRGGIPAAHPRDEDGTGQDAAEDQDAPVPGLALAPASGSDSDSRADSGGDSIADSGGDSIADSDGDSTAGADSAARNSAARNSAARNAGGAGNDSRTAGDDESEAAAADSPRHEDDSSRLSDGVSTDTREISVFAQPVRRLQPPAASRQGSDTGVAGASREAVGRNTGRNIGKDIGKDTGRDTGKDAGKGGAEANPERRVKPKRSSVPSWDDIVFGRKGD